MKSTPLTFIIKYFKVYFNSDNNNEFYQPNENHKNIFP